MLYHILYSLQPYYSFFNIFKYITFRTAIATLTSLLISLILGPYLIEHLKKSQIGENIRENGPSTHFKKAGTPTMGGSLIIFALIIPTLLWARLDNIYIWAVLIITVGYGIIGFLDDYKKYKYKKGMVGKEKLILQILVGLIVTLILYFNPKLDTTLTFPFLKNFRPDLGIFYIPFALFIIVGTSNAVNLTDGLDGLAIGPVMTAAGTFAILSYVAGNSQFANYLFVPSVEGSGELTIFCSSIVGAGLGFLWFNSYPAQVFMGNIGSVSLGGALGVIALITKNEILLVVIGGVFVLETVSVILQVASYKLYKKRVFKMAPIHHHFELKGWAEPKIIVRFWIISVILALLALSTLKIR